MRMQGCLTPQPVCVCVYTRVRTYVYLHTHVSGGNIHGHKPTPPPMQGTLRKCRREIHTYLYTRVCTYTRVYISIHTHVCRCVYISPTLPKCVVHMYMYMSACMYIYMYTCVCIYNPPLRFLNMSRQGCLLVIPAFAVNVK